MHSGCQIIQHWIIWIMCEKWRKVNEEDSGGEGGEHPELFIWIRSESVETNHQCTTNTLLCELH